MRFRLAALATTAALLCSPRAAPAQERIAGEWAITPLEWEDAAAGQVQLALMGRPGSIMGRAIPLARFRGLPPQAMAAADAPARFQLAGEAGTVTFDGRFRDGRGSGDFTFTPDAGFAAGLSRRGLERPTAQEQLSLTLGGARLAVVDEYLRELAAHGYARPGVRDLARLVSHDVQLRYVRELAEAGLRGGSVAQLIRLHNHRVDAGFIRELRAAGYTGLSADQLVRLRNHSVTPRFIRQANQERPRRLSVDELVRLRRKGRL